MEDATKMRRCGWRMKLDACKLQHHATRMILDATKMQLDATKMNLDATRMPPSKTRGLAYIRVDGEKDVVEINFSLLVIGFWRRYRFSTSTTEKHVFWK